MLPGPSAAREPPLAICPAVTPATLVTLTTPAAPEDRIPAQELQPDSAKPGTSSAAP